MTTKNDSILNEIAEFLLLLTQKERYVIERRFNLDNKDRSTLEQIGQHFSVTRERIRQIEKNALAKLKRNLPNCGLLGVSEVAYEILMENGGVMKEDLLVAAILNKKIEFNIESLQLILTIDERFKRVSNTVSFHPYIIIHELNQDELESLCRTTVEYLSKSKVTMSISNLYNVLVEKAEIEITQTLYKSLIQVDKKIKLLDADMIGLYEWRNINPRTLRDKIFFVLREQKGPMHFMDIANKIIDCSFDKKKINLQAVHNELIRHDDFILIGRGIYGLSEWGYKSGTVADVIQSILKGKESMSQDEIIIEVMKQRKVKSITIVLSLKNKENFVRVGRKQYALKK
jgi:Sigma-70, region 4